MAQNIYQVRESVGGTLSRLVDEVCREAELVVETVVLATLPGDSRRLRGIPMFAKGVSGIQTDSFVPGSDEHLEQMDAA